MSLVIIFSAVSLDLLIGNPIFMEKLVSIIIPCRNEEKFIGKCLNSIIAQDYPKERLEVLFIDGEESPDLILDKIEDEIFKILSKKYEGK